MSEYMTKFGTLNTFVNQQLNKNKAPAGSESRRKTQQSLALGERSAEQTRVNAENAVAGVKNTYRRSAEDAPRLTPDQQTAALMQAIQENSDETISEVEKEYPSDTSSGLKNPKSAEVLRSDTAFMSRLNTMIDKYPGLTEREVFKIIEGESAFDSQAVSSAKAVTLFQFIPKVVSELGFTPEEAKAMEPTEQLGIYEKYLKRWKYDGSYGLGILQAAPAYRNSAPDTVIYSKDSSDKKKRDAWEQNPGWRSSNNGPITKKSIEAYYGRTE